MFFVKECARIFETLQTDYYEEYKMMGLADLAVAVVHPLLKEKLRSWDPLKVCFCNYLKIYAFPSFMVVTVHVFVVGILALIIIIIII